MHSLGYSLYSLIFSYRNPVTLYIHSFSIHNRLSRDLLGHEVGYTLDRSISNKPVAERHKHRREHAIFPQIHICIDNILLHQHTVTKCRRMFIFLSQRMFNAILFHVIQIWLTLHILKKLLSALAELAISNLCTFTVEFVLPSLCCCCLQTA